MKSIYQVFGADVVAKILLGIAGILLIRMMPIQEYATYTLATAWIGFGYQGVSQTFNRVYIVAYESLRLGTDESVYVWAQLAVIAILALAALPFAWHLRAIYILVVAVTGTSTLCDFAKTTYQRELRFIVFSAIEIARAALFIIAVVTIAYLVPHHLTAPTVLIAQGVAMGVAGWYAFHRRQLRLSRFDLGRTHALVRALFSGEHRYLFAYFVVLSLFAQVDVFLLGRFAPARELATYGAAFRYYALLSLSLGAVHSVLLPVVHRARRDGLLRETLRAQRGMLIIFIPAVALGAWASGWLIPLIDGGRYPESILVFRVLSVSSVISIVFSPHVNIVFSEGRFRLLFKLSALAVAICTMLNLLLIPRIGAAGSAVAHLMAHGVLNVSAFIAARRALTTSVVAVPENS